MAYLKQNWMYTDPCRVMTRINVVFTVLISYCNGDTERGGGESDSLVPLSISHQIGNKYNTKCLMT